MGFKDSYSLENRTRECKRILLKYPERIPIICEKNNTFNVDCPEIDKNKYLVPNDLSVAQFMFVIRKRMKVKPEVALFLFVRGNIPAGSAHMCDIYDLYKDTDGYLYITYSFENTFG